MDFETFKTRLADAGITRDDDELRSMFKAMPAFQAMRARVDRGMAAEDEPAHTYDAGADAS